MKKREIAAMIDHTILKATATVEDIEGLCGQARQHHFASVCVNPCHVERAAKCLSGSEVKVCTVIGFPLGANSSLVKAFETENAIVNGAREVDMVINIAELKAGHDKIVEEDIRAVVDAAQGTPVKVIIETCYLTDAEKKKACEAAANAGAQFVKTSTGFGTGGATVEDVRLMRMVIPAHMQIKASGGIRTYEDAVAMIEAGADRLGTSAGVAIVENAE